MRSGLALVSSILTVALTGCDSRTEPIVLDGIEYQWADAAPVADAWVPATGAPGVKAGRDLWYRVKTPSLAVTDPAVMINRATFVKFAWVGDEQIPLRGQLLILPLGPTPTTLTLQMSPRGGLSVPQFSGGSQRALWAQVLHRELPPFVVGAMMTLAGLLLLSTAMRRKAERSYRGLGLFLASLGVLAVTGSRLRELSGLSGDAIYLVHEVATTLYPLGFADFVLATFGDGPRGLIRRGLKLFAVYAVAAWGLHFSGVLELNTSRAPVALFITAFLIQAIVLAARKARTNDPAAKRFLFGIGAMLVIAFPELLDAAGLIRLGFMTAPWAVLAFGLAMITVIERQHTQARQASEDAARSLSLQLEALEARTREVDALNQELRHQVAERSRQMVELLQRGGTQVSLAPPLERGDTIDGRYRVTRALGKGAMGTVHAVERLTDGRAFALKMMTGTVSAEAGARFAREAEIAARADDEHLVKVVDVGGESSGQLYIVMELVEGRSLEECRSRFGELPWALEVLQQVGRGVRALHAMGVVHRDLKPANVLLTTGADGREVAKISDFGISRLESDTRVEAPAINPLVQPDVTEPAEALSATWVGAAPGASMRESSPKLTGTGAFMGTPAYMAPELARGAQAGGSAADLFALGLIAYEVLSGKEAFAQPALFSALAGRSLPPIAPLPAKVPAAIATMVLRCLSEAPQARPTAPEFLDVVTAASL